MISTKQEAEQLLSQYTWLIGDKFNHVGDWCVDDMRVAQSDDYTEWSLQVKYWWGDEGTTTEWMPFDTNVQWNRYGIPTMTSGQAEELGKYLQVFGPDDVGLKLRMNEWTAFGLFNYHVKPALYSIFTSETQSLPAEFEETENPGDFWIVFKDVIDGDLYGRDLLDYLACDDSPYVNELRAKLKWNAR